MLLLLKVLQALSASDALFTAVSVGAGCSGDGDSGSGRGPGRGRGTKVLRWPELPPRYPHIPLLSSPKLPASTHRPAEGLRIPPVSPCPVHPFLFSLSLLLLIL